MNKIILIITLLITYVSYSQIVEGQNFCVETKGASYFPLTYNFNKKLLWGKTYYHETNEGTKIINGRNYTEFKQKWEDKSSVSLYLREENGVVYQYEENRLKETIRYNPRYERGFAWKSPDGKEEYKILSFNGELKTPYCEYKNLLVISAKVSYGSFNFYYLKGHGYIGARKEGQLISCETPE